MHSIASSGPRAPIEIENRETDSPEILDGDTPKPHVHWNANPSSRGADKLRGFLGHTH
jgi:hypothetical protein